MYKMCGYNISCMKTNTNLRLLYYSSVVNSRNVFTTHFSFFSVSVIVNEMYTNVVFLWGIKETKKCNC